MHVLVLFGLALGLDLARAQVTPAELDAAEAGALKTVSPQALPKFGTFYSWQHWWHPPLPFVPIPDATVYELGGGRFLYDDRWVEYAASSSKSGEGGEALNESSASRHGVAHGMSAEAYGCALWLNIEPSTNNQVLLTLNNTRAGKGYQIWSLTNLSLTNWVAATNFTGATGSLTQVLLPMTNRPIAFFRASATNDYTVDTNATFLGLNFDDIVVDNPDSMGAVGPNHFIELLNCDVGQTAIALYDKAGQLLAKTNTHDFFRTDATHPSPTQRLVDPRILYDHQAQRWVACALDVFGSGDVMLAVSTTDSPTNFTTGWNRYLIPVSRTNTQSDFTTVGLDDNGVYVTVLHLAAIPNSTNAGHTVVALKKPELYQGTLISTRLEIYTSNSLPVWTIQPAVNFDAVPTNGYAWLVAKGPPDLGTNYQGGALCYRRLQWSGTNAVLVDTNWVVVTNGGPTYRDYYDLDGTNVTVVAGVGEVSAPHLFTSDLAQRITLHLVGSRLAMTVIRNGFLWTCQAVGLNGTNGVYVGDVNDTNVTRSGVQWLKMGVNASGGTLGYSAHGRVYDRAATNPWYYYFPSLMVNCAGDMVMGFSGSSATNYIGAFYSLRRAGGGTTEMPRVIRPGTSLMSAVRAGAIILPRPWTRQMTPVFGRCSKWRMNPAVQSASLIGAP